MAEATCTECRSPIIIFLCPISTPSTPTTASPGEAEELAQLFNRRLQGGPSWNVAFLPCWVYSMIDERYAYGNRGEVDVLVEHELEGQFTKW